MLNLDTDFNSVKVRPTYFCHSYIIIGISYIIHTFRFDECMIKLLHRKWNYNRELGVSKIF